MNKSKTIPAIWMLILVALLFCVLLIYLNLMFFKLEHKRIEKLAKDQLKLSTVVTKHNLLEAQKYSLQLIKNDQFLEVSIDSLKQNFQKIYENYADFPKMIDTALIKEGVKLKYEWKVGIAKYELNQSKFDWKPGKNKDELKKIKKTHIIVNAKDSILNEIALFGEDRLSGSDLNQTIYQNSNQFKIEIKLHVKFLNIYQVIAKNNIGILIGDISLILLLTLITYKNIRILILNRNMLTQQKDLLNLLSHEFNTPLSSIKVGGQTLLKVNKTKNSDIIHKVGKSILKQQKYLQELIYQIIVLGISEDKKSFGEEAIALSNSWIEEQIDKWLENQNEEVNINFKPIENGPKVMIDHYLFKLLLINIFNNSLKYSQQKQTNIQIESEITPKKLLLKIQDNGRGMTHQEMRKAFKKFYRGKSKSYSNTSGLGLGLYLVKQIMKLHKGSCALESELGKGTTITLILPINHD